MSWLRNALSALERALGTFYHYSIYNLLGWLGWADSTIHQNTTAIDQVYVVLSDNLYNLSWRTGAFTRAAREWVEWLAYTVAPNVYRAGQRYTNTAVATERFWRRHYDFQEIAERTAADNTERFWRRYYDAQEKKERIASVEALQILLTALITADYLKAAELINREVAARKQAVTDLRNWTAQQVANVLAYAKTILPTVDKEAADGYNSTRPARGGILSKLIQDLAGDNPLVSGIVSRLAGLITDLAELDNPVVRVLANLLLKQVIDRLGVDRLAGAFASDVVAELLGGGPPKTLQDVMASIGGRLNSGEAQWQQFYQDGGDDLERLGSAMRESAGPLFTLVMGGYFAAAVADPEGTAAATDAVVTPAARAVLAPLLDVLGGL